MSQSTALFQCLCCLLPLLWVSFHFVKFFVGMIALFFKAIGFL